MTSKTEQIINDFTSNTDKSNEYSLKELVSILTASYKLVNASKSKKKQVAGSEGDEPVAKKAPSAYNLFVKNEISKIRAENKDVNPKDLMKIAAANWKIYKESNVAE